MNLIREDIDQFHSMIKNNNEIVCVIPTIYTKNVIAGIEKIYELGRSDAQQEIYSNGYKDGIKDIITDINTVIEMRI